VLNFNTAGTYTVEIPEGKILTKLQIAKPVLDADVVISVPQLKTHALTAYTGAVKNMYGIIPGGRKTAIHALAPSSKMFSEALAEIYSAVVHKLKLAVMDGVVGMEGFGPSDGTPIKSNVIIASSDCVSLDAVASKIIGFNPGEVYTTVFCTARGLGVGELSEITVVGTPIAEVNVRFKRATRVFRPSEHLLPRGLRSILTRWAIRYPFVNTNACRGCGVCFRNCPVHAMTISKDRFPIINRKKCILCYCCSELCPEGAIKLKRALII
jgi:uncharacterized protein (DUF362 family)/NAD-dependent dihydropyrimidine dehydrogenase PreA subunit